MIGFLYSVKMTTMMFTGFYLFLELAGQRYCTEAEWEKERVGRIQDAGRGSGSCHMANSIAR
jgi:hypothetical protein